MTDTDRDYITDVAARFAYLELAAQRAAHEAGEMALVARSLHRDDHGEWQGPEGIKERDRACTKAVREIIAFTVAAVPGEAERLNTYTRTLLG
jgi:hypothetical protein